MNYRGTDCRRGRTRSWGLIAGAVAGAFGLLGSSGAMAQNCGQLAVGGPLTGAQGVTSTFASGLSGANVISGAVSAANTAFLTQSTAFVSAPGNPKPDSEGGGVWVRGVGGDLTLNNTTQVTVNVTAPPGSIIAPPGSTGTGSTTCSSQLHQTFAGFQVGQDVADLNVGPGWNVHLGTTAGTLQTQGIILGGNTGQRLGFPSQTGAFSSVTEAPFVGTYAVATKGNFYVDGLIRFNYYETNLNSPTANIYNQQLDAYGVSAAVSTGYNYKVPNSKWFIEPSAGFVWSRVSVDPLNTASPAFTENFSGVTQVDNIESAIGRVGVRVGTTLETKSMVLQPFVAASVWHDFADYMTANTVSSPNGFFVAGGTVPATLSAHLTTNNIGTFGQYSVGLSGQLINTGWLGFVRVDYREGPEMAGLSGTGGIRYQFTPTDTAPVMPLKAPVYKAPAEAVNWTGYYVGAIGGAQAGSGSMNFPVSGSESAFFGIPNTTSAGGSSANMRPAGPLGGGTFGYNYQVGKWVYGFEADAAWTSTQGSTQCQPLWMPATGLFNNSLFQTTCHDNLNWIGTAEARLGYAWTPRTLFYGKAGAALAGETFSETCNLGPLNGKNGAPPAFPFQNCVNATGALVDQASASTTAVGWTVGYGTEFAFTQHWTAKAEFDWIDFGHKQFTLSDGSTITTYQRTAQGKVGVNYKF
jgi:opacity protein-like surface antigen